MDSINITMLGMTGSGKTCFLSGMYYQMSSGIQGYTLSSDDETDIQLRNKWKKMSDRSSGANRFPVGTDSIETYRFTLEYAYQPIKNFTWLDYSGGDLEKKYTEDTESYEKLKKAILDCTCLFVCVDGSLFCADSLDKMKENVRNNCSSVINGFLSDYLNKNCKLPPIAIVITKFDMLRQSINSDDLENVIEKVIKDSFSPLFTNSDKTRIVAIFPVSIGKNISDEDYSGHLEPENIYKPLFWSVWFAIKNDSKSKKFTREKIDRIQKRIDFQKRIPILKSRQFLEDQQSKNNTRRNELEYVKRVFESIKDWEVYIGGKKCTMKDMN